MPTECFRLLPSDLFTPLLRGNSPTHSFQSPLPLAIAVPEIPIARFGLFSCLFRPVSIPQYPVSRVEQLQAYHYSLRRRSSVAEGLGAAKMNRKFPIFRGAQPPPPQSNFQETPTQSRYPPSVNSSSQASTPSDSFGGSARQRTYSHPQSPSHGQPSPTEAAGIIAQLKNKSVDELRKLLTDKEAYATFFNSLDLVKIQNNLRDELQKETLQLAKENLEKEPQILELRNQTDDWVGIGTRKHLCVRDIDIDDLVEKNKLNKLKATGIKRHVRPSLPSSPLLSSPALASSLPGLASGRCFPLRAPSLSTTGRHFRSPVGRETEQEKLMTLQQKSKAAVPSREDKETAEEIVEDGETCQMKSSELERVAQDRKHADEIFDCTVIRTSELAAAQEKLTELERIKEKTLRRCSPSGLLEKLHEGMNEVDEESEVLHRQLLKKEIDLPTFIQKYKKLRTLYHRRALLHLAAKTSSLTS
ncbi:hypothetical protein ZIOFF_052445 [Zingiber officinale]|uniref:VPS37 C-terminal domain-containing protein n=1 Tax=Zingiber officinale TaxID=94328 RepID=A0A8J5FNJ7_ZINOF|nr:hypothetical protein ZIOFF_052445 [Zingiber officinale]